MAIRTRRNPPMGSFDPAKLNRVTAPPIPNQVELCTVGLSDDRTELPEETPAWVRWEQGEALVEVTTRTGDGIVVRLGCSVLSLQYEQQVVVVFPDGDPEKGTIVAAINDLSVSVPESIATLSTGAGDATDKGTRIPASTFTFLRLSDGRHYALQTQAGGGILMHSGDGVWMRSGSSNAVHMEGTVHLGVGPASAPVPGTVAAGGEEIPGVAMVPHVPEPYTPPTPQAPGAQPYTGLADGIVRAHDLYQSNTAVDPTFWLWISNVDVVARAINPNLAPAPTNLYSAISGAGGPGSKHTAEGDAGE